MIIRRSAKVSRVLTELADKKLLGVAKDIGIWSTATTRTNYVEQFAITLNHKYDGGFPDLISGEARASCTTIYFEGTEEEVLKKLAEEAKARETVHLSIYQNGSRYPHVACGAKFQDRATEDRSEANCRSCLRVKQTTIDKKIKDFMVGEVMQS
jgi:hypothetical protein